MADDMALALMQWPVPPPSPDDRPSFQPPPRAQHSTGYYGYQGPQYFLLARPAADTSFRLPRLPGTPQSDLRTEDSLEWAVTPTVRAGLTRRALPSTPKFRIPRLKSR